MLFFIQNDFYTWKYDRLFPSVKTFWIKKTYSMSGKSGRMSCVALMTTQMWPIWPSGSLGLTCLLYSVLVCLLLKSVAVSYSFWKWPSLGITKWEIYVNTETCCVKALCCTYV
jgi:hypothetical protein